MCYVHQQEPAGHVQTHPLLPQGHRRMTLTLSLQSRFLALPLIYTCSAIKASMCGATGFKNIKYKTLPYRISNHSIYRFIFSKKCKRYSNSTQFKLFFSSLNFSKEEFQKQETLQNMAAIPMQSCGA